MLMFHTGSTPLPEHTIANGCLNILAANSKSSYTFILSNNENECKNISLEDLPALMIVRYMIATTSRLLCGFRLKNQALPNGEYIYTLTKEQ